MLDPSASLSNFSVSLTSPGSIAAVIAAFSCPFTQSVNAATSTFRMVSILEAVSFLILRSTDDCRISPMAPKTTAAMIGQMHVARRSHFPVERADRITSLALLRTVLVILEVDFCELEFKSNLGVLRYFCNSHSESARLLVFQVLDILWFDAVLSQQSSTLPCMLRFPSQKYQTGRMKFPLFPSTRRPESSALSAEARTASLRDR